MPLSRLTGNSFNATANTNIDNGLLFLNPTTNRLGIFNTTPQGTLDVGGISANHSAGDLLVSTDSTNARVTVGRLSSTGDDNTMFRVRNRIDQTAFFVHAGNRTANVALTFGVGGATPATSGSGITFPASQSASSDVNTLDDYEEGTWTPTLRGSAGSAGSYAQSTQSGTYIKIGKMVWIYGFLQVSNKGSYSGVVYFNLPFAAEGNFLGAGAVRSQMHSFSGTLIVEYSTADSVTARFNVTSSGGAQANLDWSQLSSAESNFLSFALVYQATA